MRALVTPILLLLAAGCGGGEATISGTIAEGEDLTHVWVLGGSERAEIAGDSFSVTVAAGDVVELRFSRGEHEAAHMELREVPGGAELMLRGIAVDDGIAFPVAVEDEGDGVVVEVNGVRLGAAGAVPAQVDLRATLLSRSRTGDALLVRAENDRLPDLRVVVTPGTVVRSPDGDPASLERTDFGDTLRIVGSGEAGFVVASEVVVPRAGASGSSAAGASPADLSTDQGRREVGRAIERQVVVPDPSPRAQPQERPVTGKERERNRGRGRGPPEGKGPGRGEG